VTQQWTERRIELVKLQTVGGWPYPEKSAVWSFAIGDIDVSNWSVNLRADRSRPVRNKMTFVSAGEIPGPFVVCVGLNRTGTTTFGRACKLLGLTRSGWGEYSDGYLQSWSDGDYISLLEVAEHFQCLEDFPWPLLYREIAERFPLCRFVLTTRSTPAVWLRSQQMHAARVGDYWGHSRIYGSSDPVGDAAGYVERYLEHNRAVREYFKGTGRFIELSWERGDGWRELCKFLELAHPHKLTPFPHANKSAVPSVETCASIGPDRESGRSSNLES
jgi:Sulfotransferase domain